MNNSAAERVLFSGRSRGEAWGTWAPALSLDQTKAQGVEKNFWRPAPPPPFIWMIAPPSYLKVWIRHCYLPPKLLQYVTYAVTLRRHGRAEAGEHKLEQILLLKVR